MVRTLQHHITLYMLLQIQRICLATMQLSENMAYDAYVSLGLCYHGYHRFLYEDNFVEVAFMQHRGVATHVNLFSINPILLRGHVQF